MVISIKFDVPNRGQIGTSRMWRIYEDIINISKAPDFHGMEGPGISYVEHIEIEDGVESWTTENLCGIGYTLFCEGEVEYFIDEKTGYRKARIYK